MRANWTPLRAPHHPGHQGDKTGDAPDDEPQSAAGDADRQGGLVIVGHRPAGRRPRCIWKNSASTRHQDGGDPEATRSSS